MAQCHAFAAPLCALVFFSTSSNALWTKRTLTTTSSVNAVPSRQLLLGWNTQQVDLSGAAVSVVKGLCVPVTFWIVPEQCWLTCFNGYCPIAGLCLQYPWTEKRSNTTVSCSNVGTSETSRSFSVLTSCLQLLAFFLFTLSLDIFVIFRKAVTSQDKEICGNITTQKTTFPCDLSVDSCFTSLLSCNFKRRVEVGFLLGQPFNYLKVDSV